MYIYSYILAILACNHIAITYRIYGDSVPINAFSPYRQKIA